jgi:hypothetical protein
LIGNWNCVVLGNKELLNYLLKIYEK